jgi:hypothetical protein
MTTRLSEIKSQVRAENVKGLREAMEAWGEKMSDDTFSSKEPGDELQLAKAPVYALSLNEIAALYQAIDSGEVPLAQAASLIRAQEEQLLAAIEGAIPDDPEDRKEWGLRLIAYVAGVFVPAAA